MSAHPENTDLPQEEDRVSRLDVILGIVVTLAISAAMVVWAWATNQHVMASLRPDGIFDEARLTPANSPPQANRLLFGQPGEGERLIARQRRWLDTYRWLDRSREIVTLPIDEAMDRIARENAR